MSRRDGTPKHPAHADVWLRMPGWTLGLQRGLISAAIVAAGLVTLAGASGAATSSRRRSGAIHRLVRHIEFA